MTGPTASGYRRLAEAFLATRGSANTRAAYARDLATLAGALGLGGEAVPDHTAGRAAFGVEDDPAARAAALALAGVAPEWWTAWRDGLDGRPATRRRRVAAVRAFCRWAAEVFGTENPVRELRPPNPAAGRDRIGREVVALAPAAARRLCEAARRPGAAGLRDAALVEVLYGCGLRAGEAARLDMSGCLLDDPDDPCLIVLGKGARTRPVAVPAAARRALLAYLRAGRPLLRAAARGAVPRGDADAVFLSARGRRLGRGDVWRIVTGAARRGGLLDDGGRVFPHALRHSCGTHLIQAGIDIRYVQAHLGHASPVTTEVYTHVTAAHLRTDFDRAHPRSRRSAAHADREETLPDADQHA